MTLPFPEIASVEVQYYQQADTNQSNDVGQELKIFTQSSSGPSDSYYVIETQRWAFDSVDELVAILQDFECRSKQGPSVPTPVTGQEK